MTSAVARGREAEAAAADFLERRGWRVLARNPRTPLGELDLVCADGDALVVVEVKARSDCRFGEALEAIGPRKEKRLRGSAAWFLAERGHLPALVRFDVIVVSLGSDGSLLELVHLRDALGLG